MTSKSWAALLTAAMLMVCCSGCSQKQLDWARRVSTAGDLVVAKEHEGSPLLSEETLHTYLGEPDFKGTPAEFRRALRVPDAQRDFLIHRLEARYDASLGIWLRRFQEGMSKVPVPPHEFSKCILWVYDESKHFPWGVSSINLLDLPPGLCARVFVSQNGQIVSTKCFAFWKAGFADYHQSSNEDGWDGKAGQSRMAFP